VDKPPKTVDNLYDLWKTLDKSKGSTKTLPQYMGPIYENTQYIDPVKNILQVYPTGCIQTCFFSTAGSRQKPCDCPPSIGGTKMNITIYAVWAGKNPLYPHIHSAYYHN
jgi:hypothetical protein